MPRAPSPSPAAWDKVSGVTPINEFTYGYELVEPEVEAEAHAEAKAYVWPEIKIGIYDVLCPTINPKPYIRAYSDARTAESNKPYFGWNAGVSTGVDLTLGLSLDLYFWEKEIGEIEPINLVDYDLVELPYRIERTGNEVRGMMQGDTCHVTYQVWGKNRITNSEYLIPGALLHLEKTGGGTITSDQMIDQDGEFYRTNKNGEILLVFTQNDTIPATVNATLVTGDEERDKETLEWRTAIKNYRLTAPDVDDTNSVTARSSGTADIRYLLEEYTKSKEDVDGHWQGLNGVNVTFKATGGSLEASIVTADNGGYATAKFDGGGNYDGNGTLEASAYIAAFDTTVVAPAIKIDEFKFDDDNLNKCYNLEDNTAYINGVHDLFKGVTIPVHFAKHEIEHTDYAEYAYISLAIYDDIHVVQTETCDGCEGVAPNPPYDPDLVYDYIKVSATTHWTETYTRRSVSCGYNNAENLPLDYVGINGGALSFVQENYKYTEETSSTANYKYIKTDDEGKEVVVRTATTNGSSGPTERESYQWWNNAELCGPSQCTVFEEDGKIIYLYYVIDDEHKLYVKAVFDKEGNVH